MVNDYVEIIGVLLATVWTTSQHWTEKNTPYPNTSIETAPRFAGNPRQRHQYFTSSGMTGSAAGGNDSSVEIGDLESHPDFAVQEKRRSLTSFP